MNSLKKVISLNQAAQFSGYTQDYLGYLIRTGEIKGQKVGRGWVTTLEEVKNYLFKQKIRQRKLALTDFFTRGRNKKIALITIMLFVAVSSVLFYISSLPTASTGAVQSSLSSEPERLSEIDR